MFNFNKVFEQKKQNSYNIISLDDFEDDFNYNDVPKQENKLKDFNDIIDSNINFDLFLKANVFNVLDIHVERNNDYTNSYNWKCVSCEDGEHYFALINYIYIQNPKSTSMKQYVYDFYIDLNNTTGALQIGNCTTYKRSRYFTLNYPIIKICEHYSDGPVYISDIYFDKPWAQKSTIKEILNKIDFPLTNIIVTDTISIWRTIWNGTPYYLPERAPKNNTFVDIENKIKLTTNFVNHFDGFNNSMLGAKVVLFYKMFNSFSDFEKIVYNFCIKGAKVLTDFNIQFTSETYQQNIEKFKEIVSEKTKTEIEIKNKLSEKEEFAKQFFINELPESTIEHFENINENTPNLLSTFTMSKERKSKDPYRKLDLPIIKLILKDNGIDVDKIVEKYEKEWLDNFYKFANIFYKHCMKLKIALYDGYDYEKYKEINFLIDNLFSRGRTNISFHTIYGDLCKFDGFSKEEIELIKLLETGLKPNVYLNSYNNEVSLDESKLTDQSDLCKKIYKDLLDVIGSYTHTIFSNGLEQHQYNQFIILQRFLYMFYKQYVNDHNSDPYKEYEIDENIDHEILCNMKFNHVEFGRFGEYYPFNFSNIKMKLNTYAQLYKFLEYISYAIENGYNIQYPNPIGLNYLNELSCDITNDDIINAVSNEFSLNNKPNVKLLNKNSIYKMFSTIFTNIDKRIK